MNNNMELLIQLKDIRKSYNDREGLILDGIDLNVYSGDFIVIRGESGAGKTTLLRILGLIDKSYIGDYKLGNILIQNKSAKLSWNIQEEIRAKSIGFAFQDPHLFDHLNIEENIYLPMHIHRIKDKKSKDYFKSLIEKMYSSKIKSDELLGRYPNLISGGEKQRFSILRSVAHNPVFVLADEPTANLDKERKKDIFKMLSDLSKAGKTIIVVSHDEVFLDAPSVYEIKDHKLITIKTNNITKENIEKKDEINSKDAKINSSLDINKIEISNKSIWFGLRPRSDIFLQFRLVLNDLRRNILFTVLIIGALFLGSFQFTILESLRNGTDRLLDDVIRKGSRLTRIDIKPNNFSNNDPFPDKNKILNLSNITNFIERREGIYRVNDWQGRIRKETMYGLHKNDPEFDQLIFTAGGNFTSESALEIIISERSIKRLFKLNEDVITDDFRNNIIGKKIDFTIAKLAGGMTLDTPPEEMQFDEFSISLKIAGIVTRAEAGRNFYLPIKTQLILEKWRLDTKGVFKIPYNSETENWSVETEELLKMADYYYAEKAHVYVKSVYDVLPSINKLSSLGYTPEAKIFDYKWILDTRKLAEWFLNGVVFIVAIIGGLVIFGNIQTSIRLRKKDIVLFKLLGMRDGDISLIFLWSAITSSIIGTVGGFFTAYFSISYITQYILKAYPDTQFTNLFGNPLDFLSEIVISGIILSVIAAVFPAYKAGKTNPAEGFD